MDRLPVTSVLVQMTGALILAAGVPSAFETGDFAVITVGYVVMRLAMVAQWHPEHIVERYGLFTLIVLGESVLAATTAVQQAYTSGTTRSGRFVVRGGDEGH
ncbi:MAG: hypothetical protein DLM59_07335 [Pseudonocardiales bacterium]|nr:MAG: hypothetical protein DLM59_07335 [Pseudonocardiales bacterium]